MELHSGSVSFVVSLLVPLGACYLPDFGFRGMLWDWEVPYCWRLEDAGALANSPVLQFTPIADPQAMRLWQRDLCELLGLRPDF